MLNKEKITTLVCLLILIIGIFDLLSKFSSLPKVPLMVVDSDFETDPMPVEVVANRVGSQRYLPGEWAPSEFLKNPWKETGIWRIPQLEQLSSPPSLPTRGHMVPLPKSSLGFVIPSITFQKDLPKAVKGEEITPPGTDSGTGSGDGKKEGEKKEGEGPKIQ